MDQTPPTLPVLESATPRGWHAFAADVAGDLEARLRRYAHLTQRERRRLARRLEAVIDRALEVPPELPDRIARSAERLRTSAPGADPVAVAWSRTRSRARRTAAMGAVTAMPAMVPGVGPALAALGLVVDWRYVAEQQRDLVLEIAWLMGVRLEDPTRQVRTLFLASTASAFGATAAGETLARVLAQRIARRSLARVVPGAGAAVAGALNYVATVALGRLALATFAEQAGIGVEGVIPQEVHPAMPWLRNAVVQAIETEAALPRRRPVFTEQDLATIAELPLSNREELLDLALATPGASRESGGGEGAVVKEIAEALGFGPEELASARAASERDERRTGRRLRRLLEWIGSAGKRTPRTLWRRAARVARARRLSDRPPAPEPQPEEP